MWVFQLKYKESYKKYLWNDKISSVSPENVN